MYFESVRHCYFLKTHGAKAVEGRIAVEGKSRGQEPHPFFLPKLIHLPRFPFHQGCVPKQDELKSQDRQKQKQLLLVKRDNRLT